MEHTTCVYIYIYIYIYIIYIYIVFCSVFNVTVCASDVLQINTHARYLIPSCQMYGMPKNLYRNTDICAST